jgi:uncharacterized protein (DUF1330 family)
MKQASALAVSMLIGSLLGAVGISSLHAHKSLPSAYAVIEVDEITDPASFAAVLPRLRAVSEAFGGRTIVETNTITGRDAVPPRRFAVIAFDSMEDAEAWSTSSAQSELDRIRDTSAKARSFLVDGSP